MNKIYPHTPAQLYDRIAALSEENDFSAAKKELKQLAESAAGSPKDRTASLYLARAAYAFGANADAAGKTELAGTAFTLLEKLARRFPGDADIVMEWAQAAFNRLAECVENTDADGAQALFNALSERAAKFPDIPDFTTLRAGAGFNLAGCLGMAGKPDQARALYTSLAADAAAHPEAGDLASFQARAAVNLAVLFADKNDLYTAWQLHADAASLHKGHDLGADIESALTDLGKYLEQKGQDMECGRNFTIK